MTMQKSLLQFLCQIIFKVNITFLEGTFLRGDVGKAASVTCGCEPSKGRELCIIFIQSSRVCIKVSHVGPSNEVASSSFCKEIM